MQSSLYCIANEPPEIHLKHILICSDFGNPQMHLYRHTSSSSNDSLLIARKIHPVTGGSPETVQDVLMFEEANPNCALSQKKYHNKITDNLHTFDGTLNHVLPFTLP